jgi:hypothetical protein
MVEAFGAKAGGILEVEEVPETSTLTEQGRVQCSHKVGR